jgi:hypothetical protein
VIEIREVLRAWLSGSGLRTVAARAGVDRKTARRYVDAAVAAGLDRDCGVEQLSDELIGTVVTAVPADRRDRCCARPGVGAGGTRCAPTTIANVVTLERLRSDER